MTIRIISDREVTLQMQIDVQGKALQKSMNEAIALKAERDEYQQAADKMAMEHKVERDTLHRKVAELEKELNDTDIALEECKMDWSGDVTQIKAEHKHEVDTLRQQLAAAQALIEASRKQAPVAWMRKDGDMITALEKRPDYAYTHYYDRQLYAAPVVADDVLKDAQRYQWLRDRSWWDTTVCVVADPKNSVKLGSFCPSHELLDAAIDEAIGGAA